MPIPLAYQSQVCVVCGMAKRRWLVAGLAVVLVGTSCGSPARTTATHVRVRSEVPKVAPEDALQNPPLHPQGGVPLVGDASRLWLSDFAKLAVYDADSELWKESDLPWPQDQINGMVMRTTTDGVLGAVLLCEKACDYTDDEGPIPVRLVGFSAVPGDSGPIIKPSQSSSDLVTGLRNYYVIAADATSFDLLIVRGAEGGLIAHITSATIDTTSFSTQLIALCRDEKGYVGLQRVSATEPGAVPWGPLPDGWKPNPQDAERLVTGSAPDQLTPSDVPEAAKPVLANWVGLASACLPDGGLAIIGTDAAWEYVRGTWTEHPSSMRDGVTNEQAGLLSTLGDGSLYGLVSTTGLKRSREGTWASVPTDPVEVRLGDTTLEYERPKAG